MPKGISLCYFSSISINKVKYFNFGKKKKVALNKVFYMYEVFFPRQNNNINFEVSALCFDFLLR